MMNEKIQEAFNKQINAELYSSYLYLSMSAYFMSISLAGFANWMRVQAQEELIHAMKFYSFINGRGGKVVLSAIDGPPTSWDSPLAGVRGRVPPRAEGHRTYQRTGGSRYSGARPLV